MKRVILEKKTFSKDYKPKPTRRDVSQPHKLWTSVPNKVAVTYWNKQHRYSRSQRKNYWESHVKQCNSDGSKDNDGNSLVLHRGKVCVRAGVIYTGSSWGKDVHNTPVLYLAMPWANSLCSRVRAGLVYTGASRGKDDDNSPVLQLAW